MPKTYYCSQCKQNHRSGKIYKDHLKFKKVEENHIPCRKVLLCIWEDLPKIAQRQILRYISKMVWDKKSNYSKRRKLYIREINKVILEERNDMLMI